MKPGFDPAEQDLLRDAETVMSQVRAAAGPCPHPDLLMAVTAGVETEARERVLAHVNACPACKQLVEAFGQYEHDGASEEMDRRIRARFSTVPRRSWQTMALLAAAAVVIVAIGSRFLPGRGSEAPAQPAVVASNPTAPPAVTPTRTAFVLTKPTIKVPASAVLTYRSESAGSKQFLNDLAAALEPYKKDDFAEAVRRLQALSTTYTKSPEVHYYLGVSRLFVNEDAQALAALDSAMRLADESLRDDVAWYRAIALERIARAPEAKRELSTLCSRAGEYQQRACAALKELN